LRDECKALEGECEEMRELMQSKETEVDELSLRCHDLLGKNKKLSKQLQEAETRLIYASELAKSSTPSEAPPAAVPVQEEPKMEAVEPKMEADASPEKADEAPLEFRPAQGKDLSPVLLFDLIWCDKIKSDQTRLHYRRALQTPKL
jgi:predicted nuclease with TOPRIM domain